MSSGSGDQRMRWFAYKTSLALSVDEGDVYEFLQESNVNKLLKQFYDNPAIKSLFIQYVNNKFQLVDNPQNIKLNEALFYVTRLNDKPIMPKMSEQELVQGRISGEYVTEIIRLLSDVIFSLDATEAVAGLERDFLQNFNQIKQIVDQKVQINHTQVDMPGLQDFIKSYKTLPFDEFVSKYINVDHKFIDQLRYWIQLLNIEIQRIQQQLVKKTEQTQLQYYRQLNTIYNYLLIELDKCEYIEPTIKFLQQYKYKDGENMNEGHVLKQHQKQIKVKAEQTAQIVSYLNKIYQITQQFQLLEPELMAINVKQLFETLGNLFTCSNDFKSNQQVSEYLTELWDSLLESIKKQLTFSGKDLLTAFKSVGHFQNQEHYVISIYKQSVKQFMQLKFQLGFQVSETQVFEKFNQFIERLKQVDFILSTENDFGQLDNCTLAGLDEIQKQRKNLVKPFTTLQYDVFDQYGTQFLTDLEKYQNGITALEQNILSTLKIKYSNPWEQIYKMHQMYSVLNRPNLIKEFLNFYETLLNEYSISQQQLYNSLANNELSLQQALVQQWREKKLFDYYKKVFVPDNPEETQIDRNLRMERYGKFYNQYIGDVMIPHEHQPLFYKFNHLCKKICKYHESIKLRMKEVKRKYISDSNQEAEILLDGLRQPVLFKDQFKRVNVTFPVTQYFQFLQHIRFIFLTLHKEPQDTSLMLYNNSTKSLAAYYKLSYYIKQMYHSMLTNKLFSDLVKILKAQLIMNIQTGVQNMTWTSTRVENYVEDVGQQCQSVCQLIQRINREVDEGIMEKIQQLGEIQLVTSSDGLATFQYFQKAQSIHIKQQIQLINQLQSEISQRLLSIIQLISSHFNQKIQKIITAMLLKLISQQEDIKKMTRISITQQQKQQQQLLLQQTTGADKIRLIIENIYKDVKRQTLQTIVSIYTNSFYLITKMGQVDIGPIEIFINTGKSQYTLYPTREQIIQETQSWITHIINSSKNVALWNTECLVNQNMLKMIEATRESIQKQLVKLQTKVIEQKPQTITSPDATDKNNNNNTKQLREPILIDQEVKQINIIEQQSYNTVQSNCNLYNIIGQSKKVVTQQLVILQTVKRAYQAITQKLDLLMQQYSDIYSLEISSKQHLTYTELQQQIQGFQDKQDEIQQNIGKSLKELIFEIQLKQVKQHFISQLQKAQQTSLLCIQQQTYQAVKHTSNFYASVDEALDIEPESLDDIRAIMKGIQRFADYQAQSDMTEYKLSQQLEYLRSFGCKLNSEIMDAFEKLNQYNYDLQAKACEKHEKLKQVSPVFQDTLRQEIIELQEEEKQFAQEYDAKGPLEPNISSQEASNRTQYYYNLFTPLSDKLTACMEGETLFGLEITPFPRLMQLRQDFKLLTMLYQLYNDINTKLSSIGTQNFFKLNTESLQDEIKQFQMRCYKLPKSMRQYKAYEDLKAKLNDLEQLQPILSQLQAPELIERHWAELSRILGKQEIAQAYYDPETFRLSTLLSCDLIKFADDIEEVYNGAIREGDIEKKFRALYTTWTSQTFEFVQGNGKFLFEPKITSDLMGTMDESMQLLGTLKSNKYNKPFRSQITVLYANLTQVDEYLSLWLQVQQNFVYLEAVFASGDISRQLPAEAKRFANIEKIFVRLMNVAQTIRNVIQLCCSDETHKTLPLLQEQIEVVQKNLSSYLEQKRNKFPRFCFVSDSVLIEILGNQSEVAQIVQFLPQLFDSLFTVGFAKNSKNTIAQIGDRNGEVVELTTPFVVQGIIEEWLHGMIDIMRKTLKQSMADAQEALTEAQNNTQGHNATPGGGELSKLVMEFPAQTALVCLQIQWTTTCEACFKAVARGDRRGVELMSSKIQKMLDQLIKLTRQRTMPRPYLRTAIETMITIMVHQKDIFDELREQRVNNAQDFTWTRQARAYWDPVQLDCYFQITDINFPYQYEYLGVNERLVVTPLTDRCYITLAQAIGLNRGGAPAGPAGTGKTETCKDLGRLVGQYVIVQNCSDQMDYQVLGKIFRGIAQGGIYGDFDEFNRIDLDVMSVAAQQLNCIFQALMAKKEKTEYTDGTIITVKTSCAYFITMNPGYAGRQELLENLKALFRSVAMICLTYRCVLCAGFTNNFVNVQQTRVCATYVQRQGRFISIFFLRATSQQYSNQYSTMHIYQFFVIEGIRPLTQYSIIPYISV